ncbi:hypothetical protein C4559_01205 [Candidatus Microgenomates bacterium]|nr:MAG: hypothetical protein C4559_01205 [Candidatus Microgenomates bacterium]
MEKPVELENIRIITVSGRIASGATTLAEQVSKILGWKHIEGGEIFWEAVRKRMGLEPKDTNLRPDDEDKLFDEQLKKTLKEDKHIVLETKLAGYNAQGIEGVFKILVVCDDNNGVDQARIRIDRLINREKLSIDEAKKEVVEREKNDIEKWRRIYAKDHPNWVYWDEKYYDLVINTYSHNKEESLKIVLQKIGYNA